MKELHKYKELPYKYKLLNFFNMKKEAAYLSLTGRGIPVNTEDYYKLIVPDNWILTDEEEYITNFLCTPYKYYNDKNFIAKCLA